MPSGRGDGQSSWVELFPFEGWPIGKVWRDVAGKKLTVPQVTVLVSGKTTTGIHSFKNRAARHCLPGRNSLHRRGVWIFYLTPSRRLPKIPSGEHALDQGAFIATKQAAPKNVSNIRITAVQTQTGKPILLNGRQGSTFTLLRYRTTPTYRQTATWGKNADYGGAWPVTIKLKYRYRTALLQHPL